MQSATTSAKVSGGWSDFFGNVKGIAQDALYSLGNEVLPNWTKKTLDEQMNDLLNDDTYDKSKAQPRVETISAQDPTLFDFNKNYNAPSTEQSSTGNYLAIGVIVILAAVVVKGLI